MEKIKFSLEIGNQFHDVNSILDFISHVENLNFYGVYYDDAVEWSTFDSWTILSLISKYSKKIRLGPAMTFINYRNPVMLAKIASTIDQISDGRLEFRIGIGDIGVKNDCKRYNFPLYSSDEKFLRLKESIELIKNLWMKNKSYKGTFYSFNSAHLPLNNIQSPFPPITISGTKTNLLELCVDHADQWESIETDITLYKSQLEELNKLCDVKGRNCNKLRKSLELFVAINEYESDITKTVKSYAKNMGLPLNHSWINKWFIGNIAKFQDLISTFHDLNVEEFVIVPITNNLNKYVESFATDLKL